VTTASARSARLTAKGAITRARIVDAAAGLVQQRGIADTTLEDVKQAAGVSSSQLYHYFADKDALVRAVVARQADLIVAGQQQTGLGSVEGLRRWRDGVVEHARAVSGVADGFTRWAATLRTALRGLDGSASLRPGTDPDALAQTMLATVQGGLLLAQVHRDARPLETALDTLLALGVAGYQPDRDAEK
jgi:TetR/AcrR family transcriptional repressor of nem operon